VDKPQDALLHFPSGFLWTRGFFGQEISIKNPSQIKIQRPKAQPAQTEGLEQGAFIFLSRNDALATTQRQPDCSVRRPFYPMVNT
jgi:hypothetical protein